MKNTGLLYEQKDEYPELERLRIENLNLEAAKTEFLKIICHGIWTPLNGIVGPVQLLKEFPLTESMESILNILENSVSRLEDFLQKTILVTELRLGKHKLNLQEYLLIIEIENCICCFEKEIKNKNLRLNINIPDQFNVRADKKLMQKCINNILSNAISFSNNHGIIDVNGTYTENSVRIEIVDRGSGFSETILKNGFKPFSSDENHNDKSLGLGLYLISLVIKAHSGNLEIKNNIFGGATVELNIPKVYAQ